MLVALREYLVLRMDFSQSVAIKRGLSKTVLRGIKESCWEMTKIKVSVARLLAGIVLVFIGRKYAWHFNLMGPISTSSILLLDYS